VSLFHGRWSRRVSLLAAGALGDADRATTLAHLEGCAACRAELAGARGLIALVERDPVREAEPAIPLGALVARVHARLAEAERSATAGRTWSKVALPLAAAAAVIVLIGLWIPTHPPHVPPPSARPQAAVSEEALRRLEKSVARENAVRYLSEAQDVLVTVAAAPLRCDRKRAHVDVGDEARRSRELLTRRALLVDTDRDEMAGARPVLEDVSDALREVAALDPCSRPEELEAIQQRMARGRLLMKIDLMTRELQG
jgi:putative zinc finger protein